MYKSVLKSIVVSGGLILRNFQGKVERKSKESDLDEEDVRKTSIAHTELDDLIQEISLEILYNHDKNFDLNVEEDTDRIQLFDGENKLVFHLDPLDGTYAFTEERDDYAIGAGISNGTKFMESMVYLPARDRLYYATYDGEFEVMNSLGELLMFDRPENIKQKYVEKRCEDYKEKIDRMGLEKLDSLSAHNTMIELAEGNAAVSLYHRAAPHDFGIPKLILENAGGICTDENGDHIEFDTSFDRVEYFFAFATEQIRDEFFEI